ncbi:MAG: hypothetical protein B6I34_05270 [Anaerolineaceae bacterium 4572_32.1]|nr:MAG: hypothetical protein B6I34_05270 [Anaerolineaceae bacterium 4572_32.1]
MIARELLILIIGIFVGGNLGILMMCLAAMAKQADEQMPSAELAWIPKEAR